MSADGTRGPKQEEASSNGTHVLHPAFSCFCCTLGNIQQCSVPATLPKCMSLVTSLPRHRPGGHFAAVLPTGVLCTGDVCCSVNEQTTSEGRVLLPGDPGPVLARQPAKLCATHWAAATHPTMSEPCAWGSGAPSKFVLPCMFLLHVTT